MEMKVFIAVAMRWVIAIAACLTAFVARPFTVVLDPGHGGKDYGAKGVKAYEKDINLDVVLMIQELLDKNYDDIVVLTTRSDDRYLTLKERADFANYNSGNLFVSIHVNSVDRKNRNRTSIEGASVYTLGLHKSEANFEVAKRENAVMSLEQDYTTTYEGFDPNSTESYIIFEMGQSKYMSQSITLAGNIQSGLINRADRADRGVRQAGFWVLWATAMPAVLVELDFICNPAQEKFMCSKAGQKKMATAIADAIGRYAESHAAIERTDNFAFTAEDDPESEQTGQIDSQPTAAAPVATNAGEKKLAAPDKKDGKNKTYHIQLLASAKALKSNSSEFKGYKAKELREGKWYKYYTGNYGSLAAAKKELDKVRKKFPEAFIIAIQNGKRVKN